MSEKKWSFIGYDSEKGCDICGEKPARIEPRFGYRSCKVHSKLSPVRFSQRARAEKEDNEQKDN